MEFIRVIENPRHCMQRLGFLKYVVHIASQTSVSSVENIGYKLVSDVSKKYAIVLKQELQEYILKGLTERKYLELHNYVKNMNINKPGEISMELQDIYLADNKIPSKRGKLIEEDKKHYPFFATVLGLTRKENYSLLVRGSSFLHLISKEEIDGFKMLKETNPLLLNQSQKILLLFSLIEKDGDVLKKLYTILLKEKVKFELREIGYYFDDILSEVAKSYRGKTRSMDELERISKLLKTAEKIKEKRTMPPTGGVSIIEHVAKPRIEPFVDLGLLSKPEPFAYRYYITDATKAFFDPLTNMESIEDFLNYSFFDALNKAFNLKGLHRTDRVTILPMIKKAYTDLKSPLGYAPILEISLLAGIYSITETGAYFELFEALDTLKLLQKERTDLVRFNVDRRGSLIFVKFNNDIMKVLGE